MTRKDWFIVQNSIVDRDDLNVYEKMCCVVLARYADKEEFDDLLTSDIIAIKMGVDSVVAKKAVFGLIEKGLINFDGKTRIEREEEIRNEEEKINTILENSDNEKILRSESSNKKLSMSDFKRRLNAINAVEDDQVEDIFEEESKKIVRLDEGKESDSEKFSFSDFDFENMFDDEEEFKSETQKKKIENDNIYVDESDELDEEFEKNLINDEWINELEKVEEIIEKSNLDEANIYSQLSEEAKYHLGMLDNQKDNLSLKSKSDPVVKSASGYKKSAVNAKDHYHTLIDQLYEILDEQINEREARIILSFADNDIEKIRDKYKVAKSSQINDKIEVLINELQKKDTLKVNTATQISAEEMEKLPNTQINIANINKMKAYSKYSKKK